MIAPTRLLAAATALLAGSLLFLSGCTGGQSSAGDGAADSRSNPDAVVLARYADSTITVGQFERRFRQTVGDPDTLSADSLTADSTYRDFLDRYLDFRLKVLAAREAGFDTLASLRQEASSYRRQIARPRLIRDEVFDPLVRQIYERRAEEIRVRHLLVSLPDNPAPTDTLQAYRKLQTLVDSLDQGVSFGDLAERHSDDPSAQQQDRRGYRGDLGYVTAGQVVEPFESTMYDTPVDSVSGIFRTRFGYHVLKVEDRRERQQPVRIAHILVRPDSTTAADTTAARQLADSLRTEIAGGASFDSLARAYSDDRRSAQRGGDLGTVQPSGLPEAFQDAVSDLDAGDVSGVVQTRFGYHLIRVTSREERRSFEEAYDDLKQQLSRLPRLERREAEFAREVRRRHGTRIDTSLIARLAGRTSLDTLGRALLPPPQSPDSLAMTAAALGDSTYSVRSLTRYVAQTSSAPDQPLTTVVDNFLNEQAIEYATARLEERDPDFAAQMREYREGLLLFQYMQDSVWTVASKDTSLLRSVYESNKDQYRFPDRVRTIAFRAPADTLLRSYAEAYQSPESASGAATASASQSDLVRRAAQDSLVRVDTVFVSGDTSAPYQTMLQASDGTASGPVEDDGEWVYLIRDRRLPARPKSFAEARSSVVRDAQDAYEERILNDLRRRYGAETYPERLQYVDL